MQEVIRYKTLVISLDKVVISLGGSILIPGENDGKFLFGIAELLKEMSKSYQIYVVCGGGKVARYYINTARDMGAVEYDLDTLGIMATRINAKMLQLALKDVSNSEIPETVEDASKLGSEGKIVIMGGTIPGHTTDGVSASLAEAVGAIRIVNATSVDGVYTADPKKDPQAKKISKMSFSELNEMLKDGHDAGKSGVFDALGADIVMRNHLPLLIVSGRDLEEMKKAISGSSDIKGTIISD